MTARSRCMPGRARRRGAARILAGLGAVAAGLLTAACGRDVPAAGAISGTITVTGSSTIAPLMVGLGARFEQFHPGVRVNVETGGSARGIIDVRSGLAHIGMVSRALRPEERDLTAHLLARDGVAVIVHAETRVGQIDREDLAGIFTGRITNWRDVGGPDHAITVVTKAEGRSTLEVFNGYLGIAAQDVKASVVIGDNQQGIKSVASMPAAIGYVSIGSAESAVAEGVAIRLLPLNGVPASSARVADGSFPLSRELNLVTGPAADPRVQAFISYCRSADARPLIEDAAFVPVDDR